MFFQVAGDYHIVGDEDRFFDPSTYVKPMPGCEYLICTGDIIQPYFKRSYDFYMYCAKNWKKTFIIMGNQEYESAAYLLPISMDYHKACMNHLIERINKELGEPRLVFIQHNFIDLPELKLRIAGLTLWADGTSMHNLKKSVNQDKIAYTLKLEGGRLEFDTNLERSYVRPIRYRSTNYNLHEGRPIHTDDPFDQTERRAITITKSDLKDLQEKDTLFLKKMITDTKEKGYRLLMVSHFIPTTNILEESPNVQNYIDPFPFHEYCQDVMPLLDENVCAWVCGHIHREQVADTKVFINCERISVTL